MVATMENLLKDAFKAHTSGKLNEAENLYRQILKEQNWHPDANNNLGLLLESLGRHLEAASCFKTTVDVNPSRAENWENYINSLVNLGRKEEAKSIIKKSLEAGVKSPKISNIQKQL